MSITAVILAAGNGSRMKMEKTKQKILIDGKTVLYRTVKAFEESATVDDVVVVVRDDEVNFACREISAFEKVRKIVVGGNNRLESSKIGFNSIDWQFDYIAIHDGARCFVTPKMINAVCLDAQKYGAATASTAVTDTLKKIDCNGNIILTVDRSDMVCAQTPQVFRKELYEKGIASVRENGDSITDDNMLIERMGIPVHCTETGKSNIKITVREDLLFANGLLNGDFKDV